MRIIVYSCLHASHLVERNKSKLRQKYGLCKHSSESKNLVQISSRLSFRQQQQNIFILIKPLRGLKETVYKFHDSVTVNHYFVLVNQDIGRLNPMFDSQVLANTVNKILRRASNCCDDNAICHGFTGRMPTV